MARKRKKAYYEQYSKRVTKWSQIGVFVQVQIAMVQAVFICAETAQIDAVVKLTQFFTTLAGVVVTGYFGRASLEDFSSARKTIDKALENTEEETEAEEESAG